MKKIFFVLVTLIVLAIGACTKDNAINSLAPGGSGTIGAGGSLARFTIIGNYLYTIDRNNLGVFDISAPNQPIFVRKVNIGFDIETIFPFKNKLFIASNSGMFIYSLNNPAMPVMESSVAHFTGCDPVVANDSMAYLTIRGGNQCGSSINVLNVYDIRDIKFPKLVNSLEMTNPYGLGLKDSVLYICDNGAGLRVMSLKDPENPLQLTLISEDAYLDVIPTGDLLIGMLKDGIAFLDITDPENPKKLSSLKN